MNIKRVRSVKDLFPVKINSRSHDVVGDVCVLNLQGLDKGVLKEIGKSFLEFYPNVKSVVNVVSDTKGEYRIKEVKWVAGRRSLKTVHKENGFRFNVNLNHAYFSSRMQNERLRVINQVKKGERVVDLFSGVGPFIIPVSKKCSEAWAVEKNPKAFRLLEENVLLNKVHVNCVRGDAGMVKLPNADRFIMNLPGFSNKFLPRVFELADSGAVVHYYRFSHENELFDNAKVEVKKSAKSCNRRIKILNFVKAGNTGPGWFRVCVDFRVY